MFLIIYYLNRLNRILIDYKFTDNSPPLMRPFVLIADIDNDVIVVTVVVVKINKIASPKKYI